MFRRYTHRRRGILPRVRDEKPYYHTNSLNRVSPKTFELNNEGKYTTALRRRGISPRIREEKQYYDTNALNRVSPKKKNSN